MKPYYEHAGITIYHADCRELVRNIRVDAVVTDPPYGHGSKWSGGTWASNAIYDAAFDWDASTIDAKTIDEVVKAGDYAIVWGGNYYALPPSRCWLAWVKTPMPTMADFELAWTNLDRPAKQFSEIRNPDGKRSHPTQKPLSLMKWCLSFVPQATTFLDPFMGSGTTLVAVKSIGRSCIGIEREERYCEIAAKRLAQESLPLEMVG